MADYTKLPKEELTRDKLVKDNQFLHDAYSFLSKRDPSLELETEEDIYERFMEHMRFHDTNEVTAVRDLMYVQEQDDKSKQQFGRLLNTWDRIGDTDQDFLTIAGDYAEAAVSPSTIAGLFTGGAGKLAGKAALETAKMGARAITKAKLKEIGKGAAKGAAVEGAIGLGTGAAQEATRVEAGAQEEFTGGRTLLSGVAQGIGGAIPGAIGGYQQAGRRMSAGILGERADVASSELKRKGAEKAEEVLAKTDNAKVSKFRKNIIDDDTDMVRRVLKATDGGKNLNALPEDQVQKGVDILASMTESERTLASLSDDLLDKITAAAIGLGDEIKLKPNERITEGVARALRDGDLTDEALTNFLKEFDLSRAEFANVYMAEVSRAGRTLGSMSRIKGSTGKANKADAQTKVDQVVSDYAVVAGKSNTGVSKEQAKLVADEANYMQRQGILRSTDQLRLSLMTAQVATTSRNVQGGGFRVVVDAFETASRNVVNMVLGREAIEEDPLKTLDYLLFNQAEAKLIRNMFVDKMPQEANKFFSTFIEGSVSSTRVGGTGVISRIGAGVNVLNRWSDNTYKQAIFAHKLGEAVKKETGKDLVDVIAEGRFKYISADAFDEATDAAMSMVYQRTPKGNNRAAWLGRGLIKLHREVPFVLSSVMPFPRFVINQLQFVAETMPMIGFASAKMVGKSAKSTDVIAKQITGTTLLATAYGMRVNAGLDSEWYHYKTSDGDLVDIRAVAGPMNAYFLGADIMFRAFNGKPMKTLSNYVKAGWEALGGPQFRTGTGLATLDELANAVSGKGSSLSWEKLVGTWTGDMANAFTLPLATARDVWSLTDEEARMIPETKYVNGWDIFAIRATRSLPSVDTFSLAEWISDVAGTGAVDVDEPRIDILTGESMTYKDPLERQIFGVSKLPEMNALQKELTRLQLSAFDVIPRIKYAEEEKGVRQVVAPIIAKRLNTYVQSDEYINMSDEPEAQKKDLKNKIAEIVNEYRKPVRSKIREEQIAEAEPGQDIEIDRVNFEKLTSADQSLLREQYKRQYPGEEFSYRKAMDLWPKVQQRFK